MNTRKTLRNSLLLYSFFFVLTLISAFACNNQPQKKDSEEVAEDQNKPNSDATRESDERFLVKAAEINLAEIQLGQLAQQKGTNAEVKALGKMMEDAHRNAQSALTALAGSKSIAVPTTPTQDDQDLYKKFSEKNAGDEFDRDYCDKMVSGHKDAISLFENATQGNNDPDVKTWASNMLPDLRNHLTAAQNCEEKLKQMSDNMKK